MWVYLLVVLLFCSRTFSGFLFPIKKSRLPNLAQRRPTNPQPGLSPHSPLPTLCAAVRLAHCLALPFALLTPGLPVSHALSSSHPGPVFSSLLSLKFFYLSQTDTVSVSSNRGHHHRDGPSRWTISSITIVTCRSSSCRSLSSFPSQAINGIESFI